MKVGRRDMEEKSPAELPGPSISSNFPVVRRDEALKSNPELLQIVFIPKNYSGLDFLIALPERFRGALKQKKNV